MAVHDSVESNAPQETVFADPLAGALWGARSRGQVVRNVARFGTVSHSRAHAIADELYQAFQGDGQEQVAWKLAATGTDAQLMLGTNSPFVAPVYSGGMFYETTRVRRKSFVAPRFEVEIAIVVGGDEPEVAACIEIADCRIEGWKIDLSLAIADFGLQGCFVLGSPSVSSSPSAAVAVTKDGAELFRIVASVPEAAEAAAAVAQKYGLSKCIIATGTLAPAVALTPGTWKADFGDWGSVEVVVEDDDATR